MHTKQTTVIASSIMGDDDELSLLDFCSACAVDAEIVIQLVEEGVIETKGGRRSSWRFSSVCIRRTRTALRLRQDLGINYAGIAVILALKDELARLRLQLEHNRRTTRWREGQ